MAAADLVLIAESWEVEPGSSKAVRIDGQPPMLLFRLGEEYFLLDDTCTHGNASLSEGEVFGAEVECPFHSGRFDIRTGAATRFPCTVALRTYKVHIEGEAVYVHRADLLHP